MPSLLDVLGYAGNLLDLPGSSLRDVLSGNNPFDQWATPFTDKNRATGRDVLNPFLGANEETGMSGWLDNPMEGVKDLAGFGLEMVADPLNFVSLSPLFKALRGRKAAKAANAAELAASKGRYGYVNANRLADDMIGGVDEAASVVDDVVSPMAEPTGQKLLGYTPAPENPMFPGREVGHHAGHYWGDSATPQHPYGMFDLDRIHTGEGNTVKGPGAYIADDVRTTDRYFGMVADQAPSPDPKSMNLLRQKLDEVFAPGTMIDQNSTGMKRDVLDGLFTESSSGAPLSHVKVVGKDDTGYLLEHVFDDGEIIPDSYEPEFRLHDWADELLGNPIPLVEPKPTRYTLDMPAGTKGRMMNWEGGFTDQPQVVQDLVQSHPGTKILDELDDLEQQAFSLGKQMAEVKKKYGINSFTPTADDPAEVVGLRQKLTGVVDLMDTKKVEAVQVFGSEYQFRRAYDTGVSDGENMADMLMGKHPAKAGFEDITGLKEAGVPGMKNLAGSTGKSSYNYAIWDKDLINQMRIRAINEERVPINPMFGPVQQGQRVIPQIAEPDWIKVSNPMNLQDMPGLAKPAMQGAAYQALARFNSYGGGL